MNDGKIVAIHIGLVRQPRRFVVQRKALSGRDTFEVFRPRTFRKFIRELLTVLNCSRPNFMPRLAQLDDEQWMRSKHKTRRYVAEQCDHVYINSEHLVEKHTEQMLGYWVATNVGRKEVGVIASLACQAAGVARESVYRLQL